MKRAAEQLIALAGRRRKQVFLLLAVLGLSACLSLIRTEFTNDVGQMFPDSEDAGTVFRILRETGLAGTVQLEFLCGDDIGKHEEYLDSAAAKIAAIPGVKNVVFRYRSDKPEDELNDFSGWISRLFPPEILNGCNAEQAAENAVKQMAFPVPGGIKLIRNRPFPLDRPILNNLLNLDYLTGMKLSDELPWFASRDKRRAMIVFDADHAIGDAESVRNLAENVKNAVVPLPHGMDYRIISGVMHTLGNEEVLKRDAAISGTVSLLLFLILFLVFYRRDWRAFWIPAIPLFASLLALGIMTLFFRNLCLYVIGLGSCITGLAIDQGIHVYGAFRGKNAERRTSALTEPMMLSAATSILVFVYLGCTGIHAYVQLAVFAGLSLAFSCFLALIVLPLLLDRDHRTAELNLPPPKRKLSPFALLPLFAAAAVCGKIEWDRSDFSLDSMDGTPREIRLQEEDFNKTWRNPRETAVLAVSGKNAGEALEQLFQITSELNLCNIADPPGKEGIVMARPPLPPMSEQQENLRKWRTPETERKIAGLEAETKAACRKNHLPEQFFQPFFDRLKSSISREDPEPPRILRFIEKKMVKENGSSASAAALLPDTEENAEIIRNVLRKHPGRGALLSKISFRRMIREDLGGRFLWILPAGLVSSLLLAFGVFRKISDVLLAMVPVFTSFCGLFILGALTGFRTTPAAAFALILLTGLAVDYGIYAVSELRHPERLSVRSSVLLSAATTVAGAGALVFSRHPVLFGTGVVLSAGIVIACLSGLYLVPMLKKGKTSGILLILSCFVLLSGCTSGMPPDNGPEAELIRRRMRIYPDAKFSFQANGELEWNGQKHPVILAGEVNPPENRLKVSGIHPGSGMLIFRLDGSHGNGCPALFRSVPESSSGENGEGSAEILLAPFRRAKEWFQRKRMEEAGKRMCRGLTEDFQRIFLLNSGNPFAEERKTGYISVHADDGTEWEFRENSSVRKRGSEWECEYRDGGTAIYRNFDGNRTIRLSIVKLVQREK